MKWRRLQIKNAESLRHMQQILIKESLESIMKTEFPSFLTFLNQRISNGKVNGLKFASSEYLMDMEVMSVLNISETTCIILLYRASISQRILERLLFKDLKSVKTHLLAWLKQTFNANNYINIIWWEREQLEGSVLKGQVLAPMSF